MARITLKVNGKTRSVDVDDADTPLLYVPRDNLELQSLFGCGLSQCSGAGTVHPTARRYPAPCRCPLSQGGEVTTLEGWARPPNRIRSRHHRRAGGNGLLHQRHGDDPLPRC